MCSRLCSDGGYLVDVLALQLLQESRNTVVVGLNPDRVEDSTDVLSGRRGVTADGEEKVGCEVLHFDMSVLGRKLVTEWWEGNGGIVRACKLTICVGQNKRTREAIKFNRKSGESSTLLEVVMVSVVLC